MSTPLELKLDPDKVQEMPMVDLAFLVLKAANTPFYYRDLMNEVAKLRGLTEEQIIDVIAQLYTEINIDGRFACVGNNLWGLKRWYPVDRSEESMGGTKRPRIINDDDDDMEDEYVEEEETYTADEEDFDFVDEENEDEEIFDDEEEEAEVDEEVMIDEEEIDEDSSEEELDEDFDDAKKGEGDR
ncbi:DNA-directed RNA polymerase subunit delta [Paenibacillus apiarius]|uniref:Probable DNA-directed RNA polymerase subunit delta n=1 Tax=Paenibacillus apiarius TaxID=46240 RepID=A0ABT4DZR1_9BACL|nr:DNA-directed RNA polymerase subunit delta [Paenibacillus apiarius]MBN3524434.1 DNA-directed RNA polymerase subunit delta [Paenibacillus apiarius]MCY9516614.1 DNA-directed RNA polymerase subunit delta [Paenibacillus apiarius]MCY9522849.1 DNA-directed RNA polymerase subunit delta [Paenibacillus apiarius]MCY9550553.1 DNA-directed RNA polymerase subunit delta [Paenibacillus apiarius]MCY9560802.1 DNA-directed RNA polymerase subunit delta [Paenibacillus apiarius]